MGGFTGWCTAHAWALQADGIVLFTCPRPSLSQCYSTMAGERGSAGIFIQSRVFSVAEDGVLDNPERAEGVCLDQQC